MTASTATRAQRSGKANLDTRQVPLESPLALFAPDHYLASSVPAPLYLLEFVPATLKHYYETGSDGTLLRKDDHFAERTIEDANGAMWRIQAVASPKIGLPMQHDMDILLALFRIADEGGVSEDETFMSPSYRQILRAAARDRDGRDAIAPVKRALARWTVVVHTDASLDLRALSARILAGDERPRAPDGSPDRRTRSSANGVLEYSVETEFRKDQTVDTIDRLRINPAWLSQPRAGIAAWIDIDIHNGLQSPWAKRIYRHLEARTREALAPPSPVDLHPSPSREPSPGKESSGVAPLEIPDDVWGRAIRACHASGRATELALRLYLLRSTLQDVTNTAVRVRAADTFVAEWIRDKYAASLEEILSGQLGRPVTLEVESPTNPCDVGL